MNDEKDYLMVIQEASENQILDTHWERCAKEKIWVSCSSLYTDDQLVKKWSEMSIDYFKKVIKMLLRFYTKRQSKSILTLINAMLDYLPTLVTESIVVKTLDEKKGECSKK